MPKKHRNRQGNPGQPKPESTRQKIAASKRAAWARMRAAVAVVEHLNRQRAEKDAEGVSV